MTDFPDRLRALRAAEDVTQGAFADAIGASESAVQKWESGAYLPDGESLRRIGVVFPSWSVDYLLGLTSTREPNRPEAESHRMRAVAASMNVRRGRRRRRSRSDDARFGRGGVL